MQLELKILSRAELDEKIKNKNEMVPVLYEMTQAEANYYGFCVTPFGFSTYCSFFSLIAAGTRYIEDPDQAVQAIASCLLHGENSSDELSEATIKFMKNKKAEYVVRCWPKLILLYCLQKVNSNFIF